MSSPSWSTRGSPLLVYYSAQSCLIAISLTHILDVFIFTPMYLLLLSHVWHVSLDSKGVMSTLIYLLSSCPSILVKCPSVRLQSLFISCSRAASHRPAFAARVPFWLTRHAAFFTRSLYIRPCLSIRLCLSIRPCLSLFPRQKW